MRSSHLTAETLHAMAGKPRTDCTTTSLLSYIGSDVSSHVNVQDSFHYVKRRSGCNRVSRLVCLSVPEVRSALWSVRFCGIRRAPAEVLPVSAHAFGECHDAGKRSHANDRHEFIVDAEFMEISHNDH